VSCSPEAVAVLLFALRASAAFATQQPLVARVADLDGVHFGAAADVLRDPSGRDDGAQVSGPDCPATGGASATRRPHPDR
jgi:hypothetical protein